MPQWAAPGPPSPGRFARNDGPDNDHDRSPDPHAADDDHHHDHDVGRKPAVTDDHHHGSNDDHDQSAGAYIAHDRRRRGSVRSGEETVVALLDFERRCDRGAVFARSLAGARVARRMLGRVMSRLRPRPFTCNVAAER